MSAELFPVVLIGVIFLVFAIGMLADSGSYPKTIVRWLDAERSEAEVFRSAGHLWWHKVQRARVRRRSHDGMWAFDGGPCVETWLSIHLNRERDLAAEAEVERRNWQDVGPNALKAKPAGVPRARTVQR